jgi:hypothetical protein
VAHGLPPAHCLIVGAKDCRQTSALWENMTDHDTFGNTRLWLLINATLFLFLFAAPLNYADFFMVARNTSCNLSLQRLRLTRQSTSGI